MARKTIASLELEIQELKNEHEKEIERLKKQVQELKNELGCVQKIKNERGAGRKPIDIALVNEIKEYRSMGCTIKNISEKIGVSVGAVHKIVKSSKVN